MSLTYLISSTEQPWTNGEKIYVVFAISTVMTNEKLIIITQKIP